MITDTLIPPHALILPLHPEKACLTHLLDGSSHTQAGQGTAGRVGCLTSGLALSVGAAPTQVVVRGAA